MNKVEKRLLFAFSLIFGWVLSFSYQSPVLYCLLEHFNVPFTVVNKYSLFTHAFGLLLGFLVVRIFKSSKRYLLIISLICIIIQSLFFVLTISYFAILITTISFLAGIIVSSISIYIKRYVLIENRIKFVSLTLIFSNVILTISSVLSAYLPIAYSYTFTLIVFITGILSIVNFPIIQFGKIKDTIPSNTQVGIKDFWILYAFIFIITINSGLMFEVIFPYLSEYTWLTSHYTNLPYILALLFFGIYTQKQHQNCLYFGLALWGITFIILTAFAKSLPIAFIVITIMLFACGLFDCFIWSILAQNLNNVKNYIRMFSLGLFCNVLGVFTGSVIGSFLTSKSADIQSISLLGIFIIMICMVIIFPLNSRLSKVIERTKFLLHIPETINRNSEFVINRIKSQLTSREYDIFCLHMQSYTDKDICDQLYISRNTVKTHNKNIYKKLNVANRKELYNKYFEHYIEYN